jgi:hypothetical protein
MIRRRRPENLIREVSFPTRVLTAMYDIAPACEVEAGGKAQCERLEELKNTLREVPKMESRKPKGSSLALT